MLKNLKYYLIIIRPLNLILTIFSVFIAAYISPYFYISNTLILAMISAGLVAAAANIINDVYDVEIDRINKPYRPLPANKIAIKNANIYYGILNSIAISAAFFAGYWFLFIAAFTLVLLFLYAKYLKGSVFWGNLLVGLCSSLVFIYGAKSVNDWKSGIYPALFALFFHLGREILKDVEDVEGDLKNNAITFAGKFGVHKSLWLVYFIFTVLILLTISPYIQQYYGVQYLYLVIITVDLPLTAIMLYLILKKKYDRIGSINFILKLIMIFGLLSLLVGGRDVVFFN
jgi:geranylgeranylglycerol-phosphate geranylgeranyltransferase